MRQDRVASVAFFLFAAGYLGMGFFTIGEAPSKQVLGPDVFPKAVGTLMLFLSVLYVMQSYRGSVREDEQRAAVIGADERLGSYMDWKTVGTMLVLMLVYAFAFERLGYPIATFLMFMAGVFVLDRRHLARDAVIAVLGSFGLYFAFAYLLRVQLPAGPLIWLGL